VIEEHPRFTAFNPFDEHALSKIDLNYPFWIKPIKAFASQLGFRIHNAKEFHESIAKIQKGISRFADPFTFFLKQVELPQEVAHIHGGHCLAEEIITGRLCTLEGYVWDGEVVVYGVIDSIREPNRSTFSRYEYPSRLPKPVQERMIAIAKKVMTHLRYNNAPFNLEMFYDEAHDKISLLEINPRISQSHCDLFEKVDGASHHEVMIDLALGKKPDFPHRKGAFGCAAKFFFRVHEDAVITYAPTGQDIEHVKTLFPGTLFNIHVKTGMRPSDLLNQESYSYELGYVCMGANSEHELLENHRKALDYLRFEISNKESASKGKQ
jgi:biotin carboxylase